MINNEYKFVLTKDPITTTKGVYNSKFVKVLEIMLWGFPVKLGDYEYVLAETEGGGYAPLIIVNSKENLVQGMPDMTIMNLSELVSKMSDTDFEYICTNYAFSKALHRSKQRIV